jgi:hypothetical protein
MVMQCLGLQIDPVYHTPMWTSMLCPGSVAKVGSFTS